jgi:hypothetical protein
MQALAHFAADCCPPSGVASTSTWCTRFMVELRASKVEPQVVLASTPELPEFCPNTWPIEVHMPALPNASLCRSWNS